MEPDGLGNKVDCLLCHSNLYLTSRLTETEKKDNEYKKLAYKLAKEYERVCTCKLS